MLVGFVNHAGGYRHVVARAFSCVYELVCLSLCLFVCAAEGKPLELLLSKFAEITDAMHALMQRSKRQRTGWG